MIYFFRTEDIEKDFSIDINTIADDFVSKKDERKRIFWKILKK